MRYSLSLDKLWVTQCGWLELCAEVFMVMYITNLRKIFIYGVKRDQYNKFIGIRELLKILALDCFKIYFQLILGLW